MTALLAYHSDQSIKDAILAQLAAHRVADELIKGIYWDDGKGCAIGCTLHSSNHVEYETRFGIPQMLARLEDRIFERLPNGAAKLWPERFMTAFVPGRDYSRVGWQFLHWLLTDPTVNPGIEHELVREAVKQCADVVHCLSKGQPVTVRSAESAESAAWSAVISAERSAVMSAESAAWSAVRSAESAAWSAVRSAESAVRSAVRSAESAAWSAVRSARRGAESAERSAESAAYSTMADKLIKLIEEML